MCEVCHTPWKVYSSRICPDSPFSRLSWYNMVELHCMKWWDTTFVPNFTKTKSFISLGFQVCWPWKPRVACYLNTTSVGWYVNLSVYSFPPHKIVMNIFSTQCTHFLHEVLMAALWLSFSESLHFVSLSIGAWGTDSGQRTLHCCVNSAFIKKF